MKEKSQHITFKDKYRNFKDRVKIALKREEWLTKRIMDIKSKSENKPYQNRIEELTNLQREIHLPTYNHSLHVSKFAKEIVQETRSYENELLENGMLLSYPLLTP